MIHCAGNFLVGSSKIFQEGGVTEISVFLKTHARIIFVLLNIIII